MARARLGLSRRAFIRVSGLGVAAVGAVSAVPGLPSLLGTAEADAPEASTGASAAAEDAEVPSDLVARVIDPATGEMHLYFGEQQVVLRDPALLRQLANAAKAP